MRIRSILPDFYRSEDVAAMDWHTRLVFIGLWSYVDDNGVGRDTARLVASDIFPLDGDPTESLRRVSTALEWLSEHGQIQRYKVDGTAYFFVTQWDKYQRVQNPGKERYPRPTCDNVEPPDTLPPVSVDPPEALSPGEGEKGRRGEGEKTTTAPRTRGRRIPDDFAVTDQMRQWAQTEGLGHLDLDRITIEFRDYWSSESGAKASKVDWTGTWRNRVRAIAERTGNGRPNLTGTKGALKPWEL